MPSTPSDLFARLTRRLRRLFREDPPETRAARARREAREFLEARREALSEALSGKD